MSRGWSPHDPLYTESDRKLIVKLYLANEPMINIMARTGACASTVLRFAREAGHKARANIRKGSAPSDIDVALEMYFGGVEVMRIEKATGISYSVIKYHRRLRGLPPRKRIKGDGRYGSGPRAIARANRIAEEKLRKRVAA